MIYAILLIIAFVGSVSAACDNQCSGHGYCSTDDVCKCYDNWGMGLSNDSGDCSERICPFEISWVDSPSAQGRFHKYLECAGRGICDRSTGECSCFEGYDGKGCQRSTCPNDCSGHGTCEYIEDIAYSTSWAEFSGSSIQEASKTFAFRNWDNHKTRGCVCDATYGDVDCSKRMCPYGTDVLDVSDNLLATQLKHKQSITFWAPGNDADNRPTSPAGGVNNGRTFALTFKSKLNETFTTLPIVMDWTDAGGGSLGDMEHDIQLALLSLPNRVIDGVTAACTQTANTANDVSSTIGVTITNDKIVCQIEFTGNSVQGRQNLLTVEAYECHNGCTPKISGLFLETLVSITEEVNPLYRRASGIAESQKSDYNSFECGRRGKCDYNTGLCQCFLGYTGDNCNTLTTLV